MEDSPHGYKLLLSYDVDVSQLQEYQRFVMGRYIPLMQSMGLQIREAWQTAYGNAPNRLIGFFCDNQQTMTNLLESEVWLSLNKQLEKYVIDFNYKVVPYRDQFQI